MPSHFPNLKSLLLILALSATGCTKFQALNTIVPSCGVHRLANISYGPQPRQKLDIFIPPHLTPPAGVVVFFYGGDWQAGSKTDYRFVGQALASKGFIAILPNYGLYPQVTFPTFVEDAAQAVRWTHDHAKKYGGNPQAIFLMGHSAGAHIAALLTLDAHYLQAVGLDRKDILATAALSGPYDFTPIPDDLPAFNLKPGETPYPAMEPIHFVDGKEPPMLLIQGEEDETVDPSNTRRLAERIKQSGGQVQTIYYPTLAHVGVVLSLAFPFRWLAPTLQDVTNYFHGQMKQK